MPKKNSEPPSVHESITRKKNNSCLTCQDEGLRDHVRECLEESIKVGNTSLYGFAARASEWRGGSPSRDRIVSHIQKHEPELYSQIESMIRSKRDRTESSSVVYFVEGEGSGKIKIGKTTDMARRLNDLQIGSPVELKVLHTEPGGEDAERALHAKFAEIRSNGEWFFSDQQLLEYIVERREMTGGLPEK